MNAGSDRLPVDENVAHSLGSRGDEAPYLIASWMPPNESWVPTVIGAKASGLLRLPPAWTPDFVVLTGRFVDLVRRIGIENAYDQLPGSDKQALDRLLQTAAASPGQLAFEGATAGIFVRSNAIEEVGSNLRGAFDSYAVSPDLPEVLGAVDDLVARSSSMRVIVQLAAHGPNGWLSNERRVSAHRDRALVEGLPSHGRVMVRAKTSGDGALTAVSPSGAESRLREIFGWATSVLTGLVLIEWVWDGAKVWVVQLDEVPIDRPDPEFGAYMRSVAAVTRASARPSAQVDPRLQHFADAEAGRWKKLGRAATFHRLGFPTADVFVAEGSVLADAAPIEFARLLLSIHDGPWVIRTDVSSGVSFNEDLLPTSSPTADLSALAHFLEQTKASFTTAGLGPRDWAFLPAPLIRMQVSAMSHARPFGTDVVVDSLWGYPDGLMHLPHDSFLYKNDGSIRTELRHKPACLLSSGSQWQTTRVPPSRDWVKSLQEDEIAEVAHWCQTLADDIGKPVQLMTMHRVDGQIGPGHAVPFHFTVGTIAPPATGPAGHLPRRGILLVQSHDDLDVRKIEGEIRGIHIRPLAELRRDIELLQGVASLAAARDIPIIFEGSLLGHAYHLLSAEGAMVVPESPTRFAANVQRYGKLVRDGIPAIIEHSGSVARVRTLSKSEALPLLRQKLVEEAFEVLAADDGLELTEELADVREVLEALEQQVEGGSASVQRLMQTKRAARGGFAELIFLDSTADSASGGINHMADFALESLQPAVTGLNTARDHGIGQISLQFSLVPPIGRRSVVTTIGLDGMLSVRASLEYGQSSVRVDLVVEERRDPLQTQLFDLSSVEPS
jgi:predicted house-cleaning noncanonical NTP pyrophosphatase (MazG superfamily)